MKALFKPVTTEQDQRALATLADEIWHEYWPALIGAAQTDYMVEQFQSLEAIQRDMREHAYEYWFIYAGAEELSGGLKDAGNPDDAGSADPACDGRLVGYTGGHVEVDTNRFFISKIYLLAQERGRGFARQTIEFYDQLCKTRGLRAMYLTVNKHNDLGVRAYLGTGFEIIDAVETDIGNGFIMDDYIMERAVEAAK